MVLESCTRHGQSNFQAFINDEMMNLFWFCSYVPVAPLFVQAFIVKIQIV